MKRMFSQSRYGLASSVALGLSLLHLSGYAADAKEAAAQTDGKIAKPLEEYSLKHTVNFNNVSVTEVIRFVSKLTGYNFVFLQDDLNFNVTIVSEEPMSMRNITSALIQVLRVHGLKLLEEDNNFIVTKLDNPVNQISDIISTDMPGSDGTESPIVTKIFRIKNASLETLIKVLKPMVSAASLVEAVPQTRQLIITDISMNVDKITSLIGMLDIPYSNLQVESYGIKNMGADQIISLTEKILDPFLGGNPLLMIPQKETNTIFIVSTAHLIEQAMTVMEDLDVPGQNMVIGNNPLETFVYKIVNQTPDTLLSDLQNIGSQIGSADPVLSKAIQSVKYISSAGSLIFVTDAGTWTKLQTLLAGIDTKANPSGNNTFWIYKLKGNDPSQVISSLKQLSSTIQDKSLQATIAGYNWIQDTNSLVFTGPESAIMKLQEIVPAIDMPAKLYVYKIKHSSESQISSALQQAAQSMQNPDFSAAVKAMQWVKSSNSLIFHTTPEVVEHLEKILPTVDVATTETGLYVYKIRNAAEDKVIAGLNKIADTSGDVSLAAAIHNMHWIEDSRTLVFNAPPPAVITKLQSLLPTLDVSKGDNKMYLYKLEVASPDKVISSLRGMLPGLQDKDLTDAINGMQWIPDSRSFMFHGTQETIDRLRQILPSIDSVGMQTYLYKVQKAPEEQITNALEQMADASQDKDFVSAIGKMQWMTDSHTLVFNTTAQVVAKLQTLLPSLDSAKTPPAHKHMFLYKTQATAEKQIAKTLGRIAETTEEKDLADTINNMEWIPETETLVFRGTEESISDVKHILKIIDISEPNVEMYVYKVQKAPKENIMTSLEKLADTSSDKDFVKAVKNMEWIEESKSIVFNANPDTITKLKTLLPYMDSAGSSIRMYMYSVKKASKEKISSSLALIADSSDDKALVSAINGMKWMDTDKTCVFQGTEKAIEELEKILPRIDTASGLEVYSYTVEHTSKDRILSGLAQVSKNLQNDEFSSAVASAEWIPFSHTLVFSALPEVIATLKNLLPSLDTRKEVFLYKASAATADKISSTLNKMASSSEDKELVDAIGSMEWIDQSKTFVFRGTANSIRELQKILGSITSSDVNLQPYVYKVQNAPEGQINDALEQIASSSQNGDLVAAIQGMQWRPDSRTIVFNASPAAIAALQNLVPTLDVSGKQMFIYTVGTVPPEQLSASLKQIAGSSSDKELMNAINNMEWVTASRTFVFQGSNETIAQLKQILASLDTTSSNARLYTYKLKQVSEDQMAESLTRASDGLQNKDLSNAVKNMQRIPDGKTLVFKASPSTISLLEELLPTLDVSESSQKQLFLYKIKEAPEAQIAAALEQLKETTKDKELASAIDDMIWIEKSNTLAFNVTKSYADKLDKLLPSLDVEASHLQTYTYKIQSGSPEQMESALDQLAGTTQDESLVAAIDGAKWIADTGTYIFRASPSVIAKLEQILPTIDTAKHDLYIYKISSANKADITAALENASEAAKNKDFTAAVQGMQWAESSNSLIFNTTPAVIARLQALLPTLDSSSRHMYMYKLSTATSDRMLASIKQMATSTQDQALADALNSAQWMSGSKSFMFHGSTEAIDKLKQILPTLDIPGGQQLYVYKIQYVPETQIADSLDQIAVTLKDRDFTSALRGMQWMQNTNTLVFNTTPAVITILQGLLPSLDAVSPRTYTYTVQSVSPEQMADSLGEAASASGDAELVAALKSARPLPGSKTFVFQGSQNALAKVKELLPTLDMGAGLQLYVYKIKYVPESDIVGSLNQTASNLKDKNFTAAVDTMQWMEKSNTLIFNATPAVIEKLQGLLPSLDAADQDKKMYMYKLKAATPDRILSSINQTANASGNGDLMKALQDAKWIENSKTFIFHGSTEVLDKIKEMLPSLDVPEGLKIYVYKIQNVPEADIAAYLGRTADTLNNKDFTTAVQGMQWITQSNSLVFHTTPAVIAQLEELLPTVDLVRSPQMYMYKTQNPNPAELAAALQQTAMSVQDKDLANTINNMKWVADTKTFIFHGSHEVTAKLEKILAAVDVKGPPVPPQIYVYQIGKSTQATVLSALQKMSEKTGDPDFSATVEDVHIIPESNTLVFSGTPAVITKLQGVLPTLDVATTPSQTYIYKVHVAPEDQIEEALNQLAQTVGDKDLASAIAGMKWIDQSHAFVFNGTPAAITSLQGILPGLDSKTPSDLSAASAKGQFFIYNPKHRQGPELQASLEDLAQNLQGSGLQNSNLMAALNSMKWVPSSNSLIFTGDAASLDQIKGILTTSDTPAVVSGLFLYKPVYASETQLQNGLMQFAQRLDPNNALDRQLSQTIQQMEWLPDNGSFSFKGNADTLARLKTTLTFLDSAQGLASINTNNFFLYKLQYVQGDKILDNLNNLAAKLPPNEPNSEAVFKAIRNLKWVQENNSLMITGSPYVIDKIKELIGEFDTASAAPQQSNVFIYKPLNQSPQDLQQALSDLSQDLTAVALSNPDLIRTLQTVKVVAATQSLLFTGTPDSLSAVKGLISSVDVPASDMDAIQVLGETTFLIYKIKHAPHEDLIRSLQTFTAQLTGSDVADQTLAKSLSTVKWIPETNSLMFTGPRETLKKVDSLVEKFDLGTFQPPATVRTTPSTFVVYTPKEQTGADLIGVLHEFMQNIINAGICDAPLFDTISHLKFIEKTNSLIISGEQASIQKIQDLLLKFDIAGTDLNAQMSASNFLVYKLQYHQGAAIQIALKQVALSLTNTAPDANQALINVIDSLQWLEVTNSLLGTGDPETLAKIKQLITNLDVPLRQVFIEVLVLETSLFNSQNFGLQWGSQFQYLNKTIGAVGNLPAVINNNVVGGSGNQTPGTVNLGNPLSYSTNLTTPVQGNPLVSNSAIPFSTGFDLGVIGDILFHKGQSFISLGSLLNALQVDNDSTVIMNPKIITQDGHTSSIFVGQNIPFVGSFISNAGSNTVQTSNIEYRDVGVNLVITPTLGTNNVITLDISQDISEQSPNTSSIQGSQVTGIQTTHTTMNTRVHVPDRHFLVLSGMIQDRKNHYRTSLPCLGGLPVVGALFAENDRADSKYNVIIFLRPYIIDSFQDYDALTTGEEDLYRTQAGLHDLKEEFDAGVEMIKNLHND